MFLKKSAAILTVTAGILIFGWYGCSDDTITTIIPEGSYVKNSPGAVETYFPLNEGDTKIFTVTQANGISNMVTFEVGKTVDLRGIPVVEWIGTQNGVVDTGYFYVSPNALYFYEHKNASPEKVFELPFTIGNSWNRFEDDIVVLDDSFINVDQVDGGNDPVEPDTTVIYPPVVNKTYPSTGSVVMSVEGIEQLELNNGFYYSQAIKVSNTDPTGSKKNYYWFVANIGLVKYVLGVTDSRFQNGEELGEIVSY